MNKIIELIKKGLKWTITPAVNDKTGEKLGFVPFELMTGMTASALQAQILRDCPEMTDGGKIIPIKPQNIARCAYTVCELLKAYNGKATAKVSGIITDTDIQRAVGDTDDAETEVKKLTIELRRAEKQAERAALIGVAPEKLNNERFVIASMRAEIETAKSTLNGARATENALCAKKVDELFPSFADNATINKNN